MTGPELTFGHAFRVAVRSANLRILAVLIRISVVEVLKPNITGDEMNSA
jgi:hypothetical protein